MPKQFRVEGRSQDGGGAVAAKSFQHVASDVGKMLGVAVGASQRAVGMVGSLVAQIDLGTGHLPIAMSAGPAFFVEVEIRSLAGISLVAAPNLHTGSGIAGEKCHRLLPAPRSAGVIGVVERPGQLIFDVLKGDGHIASQELVGREYGIRFHHVRIYKEVLNAVLSQNFFDAGARKSRLTPRAVERNRIAPLSCRTIGTLRQPNAARCAAEESLMGLDAEPHLRAYGRVSAQQGKVSVSGAAGDDLNRASVIKVAEAGDDVAAN